MFGVESGDAPAVVECRSGPIVAEALTIGGRTMDVPCRRGVVIIEDQLGPVALGFVADGPA